MQNENVRIYMNSLERLLRAIHKGETQKPTNPVDLKWDHTALLCYPFQPAASILMLKSMEGGCILLNKLCFFKAFQGNISYAQAFLPSHHSGLYFFFLIYLDNTLLSTAQPMLYSKWKVIIAFSQIACVNAKLSNNQLCPFKK